MLASEVMDLSRACLNDNNAQIYTNDALLVYLKMAVEDMNLYLEDSQTSITKEESTIITIPAGNLSLGPSTTPTIPTDFRIPIRLEERPVGASTPFIEMDETEWEPEDEQQTILEVWSFREGEIKFRGALVDVDVKLSYYKTLANIIGANSVITDGRLLNPLGYLTAAKACRYIGENYQRYNDIMRDYSVARDLYIGPLIKKDQSNPTRRPGFREAERMGH